MNRNKLWRKPFSTLLRKKECLLISVGIDVSKGKSTVSIIKLGGEILSKPFNVFHNIDSLNALINQIKAYNEEARVVLETTGHYHSPVVKMLAENGLFVSVINSLRMKKYCSQSLRRAKTDDIDSIKIATYGLTYWNELTPVIPIQDTYSELKILSRKYYQLTSLVVKSKIDLGNLLDQVMPNIQMLLVNSRNNHKLTNFVKRYWHFANIQKMGKSRFILNYCTWAKKQGYRNNECKANEIFTISQNGIPVLPNTPSTKVAVLETVRILQETEKSRNTILTQMKEIANTLPECSIVLDMCGVGETLAPRLIAEIGDIHRFHNRNSLIAYAGIDAPPHQSGNFYATERHMSKRGNKYLRKTGYEIMQSLIMHKPDEDVVYQFIKKKRAEGKAYKKAMIAGLNKFLRIYYAKVTELYRNIA